jgi:phenylalanine-4-hydroxylase
LLLHHNLLIDCQAQSHDIHIPTGVDFSLVSAVITDQPFLNHLQRQAGVHHK